MLKLTEFMLISKPFRRWQKTTEEFFTSKAKETLLLLFIPSFWLIHFCGEIFCYLLSGFEISVKFIFFDMTKIVVIITV